LTNVVQNTTTSRSQIMDTDYATATTKLASSQIIAQAATAMLAQANQSQQSVLALLK
jgi:flagellin